MAQTAGVHPFAIGHAFRQGDVPKGKFVSGLDESLQVSVKNRWPDGSVKFAIVAGRAALVAGAEEVIPLTLSPTPLAGAVLTTADLRATGVKATTDCGAYGVVSWVGADWEAPVRAWISGPVMSSWIYRRQVGSDAHLVAWLEVRLFAGGAVEVLPWIENGYLKVAAPTSKKSTFGFLLGDTLRFSGAIDLPARCRTPLLGGAALSHWLAGDPGVMPRHDAASLMATRLVPTYMAATPTTAGVLTGMPASYTPLQQGNYPATMGSAGYSPSIGLLPQWDVLFLTSTSPAVWGGLQRNAYSAGRYGMHFRDETTHRPLKFSQYPNLCLGGGTGFQGTGSSQAGDFTPNATGTSPATYNSTHHPSMGFLAYLLTGRMYHLETLQFLATANYLKNGSAERFGSRGVFQTAHGANTERGAAWATRTLAQAAAASPDGDDLTNEFMASVVSNITWYHDNYAALKASFGIVAPYQDDTGVGDGVFWVKTWMQDFFTAAYGYMKALALPLTAHQQAMLDAFFEWKAQFIVGRLGGAGATEYLYRDAAVYISAGYPADTPTAFGASAGPFYISWGDIYRVTVPGASKEIDDGSLRGGNFPDATSYWGNIQPAIAYAVEHGVRGAATAYSRMISAPNWSSLVTNMNDSPVWSVCPKIYRSS